MLRTLKREGIRRIWKWALLLLIVGIYLLVRYGADSAAILRGAQPLASADRTVGRTYVRATISQTEPAVLNTYNHDPIIAFLPAQEATGDWLLLTVFTDEMYRDVEQLAVEQVPFEVTGILRPMWTRESTAWIDWLARHPELKNTAVRSQTLIPYPHPYGDPVKVLALAGAGLLLLAAGLWLTLCVPCGYATAEVATQLGTLTPERQKALEQEFAQAKRFSGGTYISEGHIWHTALIRARMTALEDVRSWKPGRLWFDGMQTADGRINRIPRSHSRVYRYLKDNRGLFR